MIKRLAIFFVLFLCCVSFCQADEYQFERSCPLNVYDGINTNYGEFRSRSGYKNHDGIDYQAGPGLPVYPVCGGTVTTSDGSGWGKCVIVESKQGAKTFQIRYAHLSKINVKTGDVVSSEAIIGLTGNTGISTGPTGYHLHFSFGDPNVDSSNTKNPIISGLHQPLYKNKDVFNKHAKIAMIVPIDLKKEIASTKIEKCIVFFNESTKKKVNNSTVAVPLKIIAEAYHFAEYYPTNPYKIKFVVRKKGQINIEVQKEIVFNDLIFDQNDYYCFTEPFKTTSTKKKYNEYYYMDWTPDSAGTYEVEVKVYVAYWSGDNLIAPTASNPDLGLADIK